MWYSTFSITKRLSEIKVYSFNNHEIYFDDIVYTSTVVVSSLEWSVNNRYNSQ